MSYVTYQQKDTWTDDKITFGHRDMQRKKHANSVDVYSHGVHTWSISLQPRNQFGIKFGVMAMTSQRHSTMMFNVNDRVVVHRGRTLHPNQPLIAMDMFLQPMHARFNCVLDMEQRRVRWGIIVHDQKSKVETWSNWYPLLNRNDPHCFHLTSRRKYLAIAETFQMIEIDADKCQHLYDPRKI